MERLGRETPTFTNVSYKKTKGKEAIDLYKKTGQTLMKWQEIQIKAIMAVLPDGLWQYMKYGISLSRRNGKGEILAAREFDGIVNLGEKICHTAHRTTTSHDAFNRLYTLLKKAGYAEHSRKKKEMPEKSFFASKQYGLEHIEISGGGIIDFRTRTDNGGLGEGFDLLIIDEAQEYTSKQESALSYTVSASPNPQIIMVGTPPTATSNGDVFGRVRKGVHQGTAPEEVGWAEWAIEKRTEDIENVDNWYEFNPSLGQILKERNIRAELSNGIDDFNIQRLGLWLEYSQQSIISEAEWSALKVDKLPKIKDKRYLGIKYGHDGRNVAVSIAVKTEDNRIFVESIDCRPIKEGNGWIFDFLHNPKIDKVAIDGANGQMILANAMKEFGFQKPILPTVKDIITANAMWEQGIALKQICHRGQQSLISSVTNCDKRAIGTQGGFGYKSLSEVYDVSLMESAILAFWLASTAKEVTPQQIQY
jgi:phage terminase large subunit-like protein